MSNLTDRQQVKIIVGIILGVVFALYAHSMLTDSPEEKSRVYNDCLTRQIEAGSPNWATTVAICEDKRPD